MKLIVVSLFFYHFGISEGNYTLGNIQKALIKITNTLQERNSNQQPLSS